MRSGFRVFRDRMSAPPVPLAQNGYRRGMAFNLSGGVANRELYMRAYGMSGTVFSIVSLLQSAAAAPKWHLYKKQPVDGRRRYATTDQGSDQRVEVTVHAALSLWQRPNDFHTGFEFREGSNQHQELTGETFWVLNRENALRLPTSMWYVRPDRMEPVPSPDDYLLGWVYTGPNGEQVPLQLDEVVVEKLPDPLDPFRGAGPVASILPNIQQQRYATEYQRNLFLNGATPGGIIQVDKRLSDPEWDELTDRWRESHQGIARAGRVGVLENGAQWVADAPTNKDMEYANLRLANRDELREAWRMHKAMLGTTEDVNRANAQTATEVFTGWMTIPRLNRRRDTLNCKLLPMYGAAGQGVEFDYEDPSPENREAAAEEMRYKGEAARYLVQAGYEPEDVAEALGLPDMRVAERATQMPALPPSWVAGGAPAARETIRLTGRGRAAVEAKRDTAAKVYEQAAKDYPPGWCGWILHQDWVGPVEIRTSAINMAGYADRFGRTEADLDHFKKQIARHGRVKKPAILVKTPGAKKLRIIDGHGRTAASADEGVPVWAYVGVTREDHGDWDEMHDHQSLAGAQAGTEPLAALLQSLSHVSPAIAALNGVRR